MDKREEEFLQKLRSTFKIEAEEHLRSISGELISLESNPTAEGRSEALQTIYRAAHSLKGAARAVNLKDVESICQTLESVFSLLKNDEISPSAELFDTLHHTVDTLFSLVSEPDSQGSTNVINELSRLLQSQPPPKIQVSTVAAKISEQPATEAPIEPLGRKHLQQEAPDSATVSPQREHTESEHAQSPSPARHASQVDTVRISTKKLDALLYQVEEMISVKMAASQRISELRSIAIILDSWGKACRKLYPDVRNARQHLQSSAQDGIPVSPGPDFEQILDFFDANREYWGNIDGKIMSLAKSAEVESRSLNTMVDDLLEDMKNLLMLPFSTLLEMFPKIVRDLSRDEGKEVVLAVQGGDIEIDRRILEEMKDPLIHLVRNSVDHGIETPRQRSALNKPATATLTILVSQPTSNRIEILVSDDGRGIDVEKVRRSAVSKRMLSEREARTMSNQEALALIFRSEVSTADIITDLSGRGLGLAIVQEKVDKLGGHIAVESVPYQSTSFKISLPVTLATFRGILTKVGDRLFVIPTSSVERVLRAKRDSIKTVENRYTIVLNGRVLRFFELADLLELPSEPNREEPTLVPTIVVTHGKKVIALGVGDVVSEQEVLVKSLGKQLSRIRNVGGATVLASGEIVTILNVSDLVKSAMRALGSAPLITASKEVDEQKPRRILLAEDSITSRILLKNILESAGYEVHTTVDGSEAWTALKNQDFDLVVSDVQMPRMTGLELTSRIRNDKKLSELPVVLVTSLESREDREAGVDVGANAYIIKSSFDQGNLLEVVERLV